MKDQNQASSILVAVNQVGYLTHDRKLAKVVGGGESFSILNAGTGKEVFSGSLRHLGMDVSSGDDVWEADFSSLIEPGKYKVRVDGAESYPFIIDDHVFDTLLHDMLKTVFYQRCGYHLPNGFSDRYAHDACHTQERCWMADKVKGKEVPCGKDLTGGWHDAGDFSVQVVSTSLTAALLIYLYRMFPSAFDDAAGIPESGNGIPDILDEARWGVEWLMKMQTEDGSVLRRTDAWGQPPLTTAADQDASTMYVYPVCIGSTGNMAATCALAARVYQNIDPEFAQTCLKAAKRAYAWLVANPNFVYPYPGNYYGVSTEYIGESEKDEVLWAKVELYATTGEEKYLDGVEALLETEELTDLSYHNRGGMAVLALFSGDLHLPEPMKKKMMSTMESTAKQLKALADQSGWGVPINTETMNGDYNFNQIFATSVLKMIMANGFDSSVDCEAAVDSVLDFYMGTNPLNFSFISGYGTDSVQHLHHRNSAAGNMFPGVVAPGPGSYAMIKKTSPHKLEEIFEPDIPTLKCYYDDIVLYRFNEWVVDASPKYMWLLLYRMAMNQKRKASLK